MLTITSEYLNPGYYWRAKTSADGKPSTWQGPYLNQAYAIQAHRRFLKKNPSWQQYEIELGHKESLRNPRN